MSVEPIRIGLRVAPQHCTYRQMRDTWLRADAEGADSLFTWDHFYPLFGDPDGAHFECWSLLAAMAEATERVHLGALVTCNSYRNPNLLADMARTVDHISGGRLILGLGPGWFERDYAEYGYEFGTAITRLRAFSHALPVIDERSGAQPAARPRQDPDLIGGAGEKVMLRLVARWAMPGMLRDARGDRAQVPVLDDHCAAIGRDPEIERSVLVTSEDIATACSDRYHEAGVRHFLAIAKEPDFDLADLRKSPGLARLDLVVSVPGGAGRLPSGANRGRRGSECIRVSIALPQADPTVSRPLRRE
jgi:probable F420-dependent oxidoreductase